MKLLYDEIADNVKVNAASVINNIGEKSNEVEISFGFFPFPKEIFWLDFICNLIKFQKNK